MTTTNASIANGIPMLIYESIVPSDATANSRLDTLKAGGITLVLNIALMQSSTITQVLAYFDHALANGQQLVVPMNNTPFHDSSGTLCATYPTLATSLSASTDSQFLSGFVSAVKSHAALWGWYVSDELDFNTWHSGVAALRTSVIASDTATPHPFLIVQGGGGQTTGYITAQFTGWKDVCDSYGVDFYGYGLVTKNTAGQGASSLGDFDDLCRTLGSLCQANSRKGIIVCQAHNLANYSHPGGTVPWYQMRAQMETGVRGFAAGSNFALALSYIGWYSYFDILSDPDVGGSTWDVWQKATQNWAAYP